MCDAIRTYLSYGVMFCVCRDTYLILLLLKENDKFICVCPMWILFFNLNCFTYIPPLLNHADNRLSLFSNELSSYIRILIITVLKSYLLSILSILVK